MTAATVPRTTIDTLTRRENSELKTPPCPSANGSSRQAAATVLKVDLANRMQVGTPATLVLWWGAVADWGLTAATPAGFGPFEPDEALSRCMRAHECRASKRKWSWTSRCTVTGSSRRAGLLLVSCSRRAGRSRPCLAVMDRRD